MSDNSISQMAYYPNLNYDHYQSYHDNNYQYYQPYNYVPHESRYVENYSYHTQNYDINSYQLSPSEPLVGYYYSTYNNDSVPTSKNASFHENGEYFYDPVSTQFVISYSNVGNNEDSDLDFSEYNPEPYNGGYDIHATYGKALPASNDICYPPSKIDQIPETNMVERVSVIAEPVPVPVPVPEPVEKPETNMIQAMNGVDEDEEEDGDEDEDEDEDEDYSDEEEEDIVAVKPSNENIVGKVTQEEIASEVEEEEEKEEENRGNETGIRRQIPAGYGMEAIDICDGLFGGYFPCLLKRNKNANCDQCGSEVKVKRDDYYDNWQGTVDYLFGNPNPYGGSMPEKGSYGDPMYCYHRHSPQESIVGQVKYRDNSSWVDNSMYYYE